MHKRTGFQYFWSLCFCFLRHKLLHVQFSSEAFLQVTTHEKNVVSFVRQMERFAALKRFTVCGSHFLTCTGETFAYRNNVSKNVGCKVRFGESPSTLRLTNKHDGKLFIKNFGAKEKMQVSHFLTSIHFHANLKNLIAFSFEKSHTIKTVKRGNLTNKDTRSDSKNRCEDEYSSV